MKISVVASSYISSTPIRFYQPVQAEYYTLGDHNLRFKANATQEDRHRYLQMQAHTLAPFSAHDILIITSLPMEIHAEGLELIKQTLKTKSLVYSYGGDVIAFKPSDIKFTKALNKAYKDGLSLENFLDGFEKENSWALELPLLRTEPPKVHTEVFVPKPSEKLSPSSTLALSKKVTFICPIYNSFPLIISSLLMQTFDNWELLLIHDGKNSTGLKEYVDAIGDTRIVYWETTKRLGKWGFPIRQDAIRKIKNGTLPQTDYIVVTNPDNYHSPFYVEKYLLELCKDPSVTIGAYCSQMVHNYIDYKVMDCRLERGYIDTAAVMFRADVACNIGWNDTDQFHADWIYINDVITKYSAAHIVQIPGCLLTHN